MIEYTTIEEDGITRACFNQGDGYFEITINGIPEDQIQAHLEDQVFMMTFDPESVDEGD
tara:strand:+ start:38926 stop:39102 length:177 start_codon:yes stop_codon:yes gene_type:complete